MNNIEQLEKSTIETNKLQLETLNANNKHPSFLKKVSIRLKKTFGLLPSDSFSVFYENKENYLNLKPRFETNNKKIVIYTCVTGGYDDLPEPVFQKENVKYVAYTDNKSLKSKIWEIRDIPESLKGKPCPYINRYIKLHSNEFFSDYDFAIYVDGNVKVVTDITTYLGLINPEIGLATYRHCVRDCLYEEAKACLLLKKGNKKNIKKQIKQYKKEGLPAHFGLFECTLLFIKIGEKSEQLFDLWWDELIRSNSGRDQLALPYVVWKLKLNPNDIAVVGTNVWLSKRFSVIPHNK